MNSREKVQKLFHREPIEGIVIDFGGMPSDGISAVAYNHLVKQLGLPDRKIKVYDIFQQLAAPDLDVIDILGGDFILAYRMRMRFGISCKEWRDDFLTDGTPCLVPAEMNSIIDENGNKDIFVHNKLFARMPKGGFYYDQIAHPLEDCMEMDDLQDYHPVLMQDDEVEYIVNEIQHLYDDTDKAIVFAFGGSVFEQGQRDFGFENFYCNIVAEPELMHAYFQKTTDAYLHDLQNLLPKIGSKIDVIHFFDDLGAQTALQISPSTYREMIKPYHTQLFQYIHDNFANIKILFHCCGAIYDIIPDLIESGIDLLNPVQISASGMNAQRLKDTFGEKVIFWGGGADMQDFVQNSTPKEIGKHVEGLIKIFQKDGGFIFSQIHNIQYDVPVEKILAIYETAKRFK